MIIKAIAEIVTRYKDKRDKLSSKLSSHQQKLLEVFLFLIRFTVFVLPLHFLLWANWNVYPLQKLLAGSVASLLKPLGIAVMQDHHFLLFAEFGTIEIVKDCLGWKSVMALLGLILAVRGVTVRNRLVGMLLGVLLIVVGNYLRLITTFYVVVAWGLNFEVVHSFLWRWGLILLILGYWVLWFKKFRAKIDSGSSSQ